MTAYTFDQIINFTRTSAATYVANTGFVTQTPASRNLLTYTQEFDNAAWGKSNATITANSTVAPDGTMTADTFTPNNGATYGDATQVVNGATASVAYTLSYYVKSAGLSPIRLRVTARTSGNVFISDLQVEADLSAGTVGAVTAGTFTSTSASITSVGGGWYRISLTGTTPATTGILWVSVRYGPAGNGTSGFYLWGAQLETGSTATTYTRNVGGVYPPRFDYDPVTLAPRGLLIEEHRTNLLLRSEEFDSASWGKLAANVTANAMASPDGTADADKVFEDTASNIHHVVQTSTLADNTNYAVTVYAKAGERNWLRIGPNDKSAAVAFAWFDLATGTLGTAPARSSITPVGNGWYRCYVPFNSGSGGFATSIRFAIATANNSSSSYTGDGTSGIYLWGAQLEAGTFATSYIPTEASQVTRASDNATITGANFSQWYNQSEGTLVVEADSNSLVAGRFPGMWRVTDGGSPNRIGVYLNQDDGVYVTQRNLSGTPISATTSNSTTQNTVFKGASAYSASGVSGALNGGAVVNSAVGTPPVVVRMELGLFDGYLNGHIRRIRYYPMRLSNAQLQALTA